MGWNQVRIRHRAPVLDGVADGAHFYFVHSYYPEPEDRSLIASTTSYGDDFASSISRGRTFAGQFHPERSQEAGLKLIANFLEAPL